MHTRFFKFSFISLTSSRHIKPVCRFVCASVSSTRILEIETSHLLLRLFFCCPLPLPGNTSSDVCILCLFMFYFFAFEKTPLGEVTALFTLDPPYKGDEP